MTPGDELQPEKMKASAHRYCFDFPFNAKGIITINPAKLQTTNAIERYSYR